MKVLFTYYVIDQVGRASADREKGKLFVNWTKRRFQILRHVMCIEVGDFPCINLYNNWTTTCDWLQYSHLPLFSPGVAEISET